MKEHRFHTVMTVILLPVAVFSLYGAYAWQIRVAPGQLAARGALLLFLLAGALFYRWRNLPKAVNLIMMTFWAILVTNLYLLPMHILARRDVGWSDALLARMDAAVGLEVPDVLRLMERMPAVAQVLGIAYNLLIFMVMLAVMVPPMCGRMDKAKEYAIACLTAAFISMPVFAVFQAIGPSSIYGHPLCPAQESAARVLLALRSDAPFEIDLTNHEGLIYFPSFHTILAILTAVALWPFRYTRWPSAIIALLIVLSTVTAGGHYISDILSGLVVTGLSLAAARGYLRAEQGKIRGAWRRQRPAHPVAFPDGSRAPESITAQDNLAACCENSSVVAD